MNKTKKIIVIAGDPNSINSELIYKSWKKLSPFIKKKIYVVGNYDLIKKQFKILKYNLKIKNVNKSNSFIKNDILKIINVDLNFNNPFKVNQKDASRYIIKSLNLAHKLALKNDVSGLINCAIDKNLLVKKNSGVTEYLAFKCNIKNDSEVMLIRNKKLSVSPITTHIDLKDVSRNIKKQKIINKVKTIQSWFNNSLKIKPKIGILGLNPHNAELRVNSKERNEIIPAIKKLKKLKINVRGPLVTDSTFISEYKNFDIIIGMYHDQVLTPFKNIFKFNAINITLGLKYLRVSPDHGIAKDIIQKNKGNPESLIQCINFISNY
jgi:4-hydroxy-L-threonine phosphate dehydrogenase PdxA